ncbi:LamG-like jellyroll fold domain-containing protein [Actinoplanes sp. NPDC051861]|uniref:LamG-like jellyroll fold domain-containing protein n=1 Tax=Actinoplanes sp. NPDC051861 TaxID=3155170 RepID=UPI00341846B5
MLWRARRVPISAALITSCLFSSLLVGIAPEAQASPPDAVLELTAEQKASKQARETGKAVPVPSLLTENTEVVANPDGSFTAEVHSGPARFRDEGGDWAEVDLNLERRPDGSVAPKAHPRGLVMSGRAGDGEHDLARVSSGAEGMTLGWSGKLPEPELHETTATYREVRPGIDLVVDATRTGFEQFLIVKNRGAAAQVKSIALPWRTEGITPVPAVGGGLRLRGKDGRYVGSVPAPVMWDATVGEKSGEHLRRAPVPMAVPAGARTLKLQPELDFFNDPATRYPVTIDPGATLKPGFDTFVQNNISSDQSASKELKIGSVVEGGSFRARSFLRWPVAVVAGKRVTAATMSLWNKHSWNCDAREWQVWITGPVGTSTNWANQPAWRDEYPVVKSTMTKGYAGCTEGYVAANVQPIMAKSAEVGFHTLTLGLRTPSAEEANPNSNNWKKFHSTEAAKDPFISITYNNKPLAPTDLAIGGKKCGSGDPAAYVSTSSGYPTAQAKATDPDGTERTLTMQFFIAKAGAAIPSAYTMAATAKSGAYASKVVQNITLVENQKYTMYVRASDGLDNSPMSVACSFTIDSTIPAKPPTVTSTDYPLCVAVLCDATGGVGVSGRFTFGANGIADIRGYEYWLDGGARMSVTNSVLGGSVTVDVTPSWPQHLAQLSGYKIGGKRVLHVVSVDQAGRRSDDFRAGTGNDASGGYEFTVASAPDPVSRWKLDEPTGSTVAADAVGNRNPLTLSGAVSSTDGNGDGGTGLAFASPGSASGQLAVPLTGNRTTVATARLSSSSTAESTIVLHGNYSSPTRVDELYFDGATQKVCYRVLTGTTSMTQRKACSAQTVRPGVWIRVGGSFDTMLQTATVYVNGVGTSTSTATAFPDAPIGLGNLTVVGENLLSVDDVSVWNRVLAPEEVAAQSVTEAGNWDFDFGDTTDGTTHPNRHDLTVYAPDEPEGLWSDFGHNDGDFGSVDLDGFTALSTDGPVLRTAESFSVSAWVNVSKVPDWNWAAVSQDGVYQSNFSLGVNFTGGAPHWGMFLQMADSNTNDAIHPAYLSTPIVEDEVGAWTHLVAVYDTAKQRMTLYVNGVEGASQPFTGRWNSTGPFNIGRARYAPPGGASHTTDFFSGNVDEVRAYAGALTPELVKRLYQTQDGNL